MKNLSLDSLGTIEGTGEFSPFSLLTCFSFPESQLMETNSLEGIRANRTYLHEYQHFIQFTSTSFGFNVLYSELVRGINTSVCIRKLLEKLPKLELPLLALSNRIDNNKIKEIISSHFKNMQIIEEKIGILFGDYEYDPDSDTIKYQDRQLINKYGATTLMTYDDYTPPVIVPVGARAIMEGAASLMEGLYLTHKKYSSKSKLVQNEFDKWVNYVEPDHNYHAIIDLGKELGFHSTMALADLALFTPFEYGSDVVSSDERSPGYRFLKCVKAAKNLPNLEITNFHSNYRGYVEEICSILGWKTPWEMITEEFLDYIVDELPDYPIGTYGLRETLSKGFELRRDFPAYCAFPLINFFDKRAIENLNNDFGIKGLIPLNLIQELHPQPFIVADDERANILESRIVSDGFEELYNNPDKYPELKEELKKYPELLKSMKDKPITKEKRFNALKSSFEKYYIGHSIINLLWYGRKMNDSNFCLKLEGGKKIECRGGITSLDYKNIEGCLCKDVFLDFIPSGVQSVEWKWE